MQTPREQLSEAMRNARLEAGFSTHARLAKKMNTSRPAISRAESPNQPVPSVPFLAAWAKATGVPVEEFTEIVERAKSGTPEWFMPYRVAEREATSLRFWGPLVVPGLLQTEAYARDLLSSEPHTPDELLALLRARMERREAIGRTVITAAVDYRVLANPVGSPEVMAEQCGYLAELAEGGQIRLHVVPERCNVGLGGAFAVAMKGAAATVALTTPVRDITSTEATVVADALALFDVVLGASLGRLASVEFVRTYEAKWKGQT